MATAQQFEDLGVWQDSREMVREIYRVTKQRAFQRDFGLRDQITRAATSTILFTPFSSMSGKRNTPQCACIVWRMALPTSYTLSPFFWPSNRANRASENSPAPFGKSRCVLFSAMNLIIESPDDLPITNKSVSELVPRRLAP